MTESTARKPFISKNLRRTARGVAAAILARAEGFAQDALHRLFDEFDVYRKDRALATELVFGCVRHERLIDCLIDHFCRSPHARARLPRGVRAMLALGTFQLIWMDSVPAHAAVGQTVEIAKSVARGRYAGLVNAVLRNVQRSIVDPRVPADADVLPTPRTLRISDVTVCELNFDILPDPTDDPVGHWSLVTSHDPLLVGRWRDQGLAFHRIALAGIATPTLCLRPNLLRVNADQLAQRLGEEGCRVALTERGTGVYLLSGPPVGRIEAFKQGLCQPQDSTAIDVVDGWVAPQPGWRILDLCAGVGTKTTRLAEVMQNGGTVVATDRDPACLDRLEANCRRLGIETVRTVRRELLSAAVSEHGPFDRVLVDVPCTNTGVLSRRPEAKRIGRFTTGRLARLHATQVGLLQEALAYVRPGGEAVYATCSLEPEENERVIERVLSEDGSISLAGQHQTFPDSGVSTWRDGGYVARLRKDPAIDA